MISYGKCPTRRTIVSIVFSFTSIVSAGQYAHAKKDPQEHFDLLERIESSQFLKLEKVCSPLRTIRFDSPIFVPNRDGKSCDMLFPYYKGYEGPAWIGIYDFGTSEQSHQDIPVGVNIHLMGSVLGPDGNFYWALQNRPGVDLYVYDPDENKLRLKFELDRQYYGQTNKMTVGIDGKIYGTVGHRGAGKAGIFEIDTATGRVTDYGPVGVSMKGSPYSLGIGADDRCVYVAYGKTPWRLMAYDRKTGQSRILLIAEGAGSHLGIRQYANGCVARGKGLRGTNGGLVEYWLHQGKALAKEDVESPPWGLPINRQTNVLRSLVPFVDISQADPTVSKDNTGIVSYRFADQPPKEIRFKAPLFPAMIKDVVSLGDGRILGIGRDRSGYFIYDPKSDSTNLLGRIRLEHHATAVFENRVYMTGYPGAPLWQLDPAKPWTATYASSGGASKADAVKARREKSSKVRSGSSTKNKAKDKLTIDKTGGASRGSTALIKASSTNKKVRSGTSAAEAVVPRPQDTFQNPRMLCQLRDFCGIHFGLASAVGADGRIYFGGKWYRDGKGGGLAWWDPAVHEGDGFWEIFSNYQISDLAAAEDGQLIVISTQAVPDLVLGKSTPEQGKLFVYDTAKHEIVREIEPIRRALFAGRVASTRDENVIGLTVNPEKENSWLLYGVDLAKGQVTFTKDLPAPPKVGPQGRQNTLPYLDKTRCTFEMGPDGCVWFIHLGALIRVYPKNGDIDVVGKIYEPLRSREMPLSGGKFAFSGRDVYIVRLTGLDLRWSVTMELVRDVVPLK
jgi:hypothetical protein